MKIKVFDKRPFNPDEYYPWKGMRRCALQPDGTVYKYHDKNNTNLWKDGTSVDWNKYEQDGLNCMVEIPKFYYRKLGFNASNDYENGHIWGIANVKKQGFELHPAFMRCRDKPCDDQNGIVTEVDYRYRSAFLGWKDRQGRLRSLPNKSPQVKTTIGQARNYAKANGNGWGIVDFNLHFATQLLYAVEYGDYDSQTALGRGYVDGNNSKTNTGETLQYGNNSYGETTGKKQMSYRGIEDFWGNCKYWIDGFYCNSNRHILIGNKGFNNSGSRYEDKGQGASSNLSGYIGNIQNNKDCGFVMSDTNGNSTTKLHDFGYLFAGCLPLAGGAWSGGSYAGAFYFYCYFSASVAYSYVAASVAF